MHPAVHLPGEGEMKGGHLQSRSRRLVRTRLARSISGEGVLEPGFMGRLLHPRAATRHVLHPRGHTDDAAR